MRIGLIGGGLTGLTAAYELSKQGHTVTVFEKESYLGGLAYGFKQPSWDWHLESAYHHLFTNDEAILLLMKQLNLQEKLIVKRPITATLWNNNMYPLDSALSLLQFPGLPFIDRVRTGLLIGLMKINPFWQPLERFTAASLFRLLGGEQGWKTIWEPLMIGKFGEYTDTIAASWLWARIKKRTPKLVYIEGGFQTLIDTLERTVNKHNGIIHKNTGVTSIVSGKDKRSFVISYGAKKHIVVDKVISTVPTPLAQKLIPELPSAYFAEALTIPHLFAQVLIIESEQPLFNDLYWINITDRTYPFLAVVNHTNYMDSKHYGGKHLTYIGNYLPANHPFLKLSKEQLWKKFLPYLKKMSSLTLSYSNLFIFSAPFAQPVHQIHYSQRAPNMNTPLDGLIIANMDSIYPWDRGTNYAVELGQKAAHLLIQKRG